MQDIKFVEDYLSSTIDKLSNTVDKLPTTFDDNVLNKVDQHFN